jgi:hypothetical protein
MKYRFDPPGKTFPDHDGSGPGLEHLPQALLDRHGARVLHPSSVPVAEGWPTPRSTVYRARTLLVPQNLHNQDFLAQVTLVLERVGMVLEPVAAPREVTEDQDLADVPTIAVLTPIRDGRAPVVVDAWVALTALRDATNPPKGGRGGDGHDQDDQDTNHATAARDGGPILKVEAVRQITLEHLLVGAMITGSPEIDGNP